ncbi:S-layer homology domain-containing protein [Paenibacillus sp. IHBB 10380]|uniref:S-layer homology domain-containing protein n=1 Tax=Paenibacillus sp. IHBB 10380 TaxID=1566358 RepID=UPI0005CF9A27|nr:S-layer homology domain-containing protein [Paenibacillus sp. IHBB 10380]AJS58713.1 hypothetical protein UB51_09705 [Paenibacillus sp. IHBB 10380]
MKTLHKFTTLAIATVLTLSLTGHSLAATAHFTDLDHIQGKDQIEALYNKGFIKGIRDHEFQPNATITSAQGVQMIVNSFQLSLAAIDFNVAPQASDLFTKVHDDAWYTDAFIIAILNGVNLSADIDPAHKLTREEFTSYVIHALEKDSNLPLIRINPVDITDGTDLNTHYSGTIQIAVALGITTLDDKGYFHPKEEISRADAAVMTYNALEYLKAHPRQS